MGKNVFITGGAGFIGTNTCEYYLKKGHHVYLLDNFTREGSKINAKYLSSKYKSLTIIKEDVTSISKNTERIIKNCDIIFHFAGQVAVTTSIDNPRKDFNINAAGTLNMLEIARKSSKKPIFLYSSTNKVYGELSRVKVVEGKSRYSFKSLPNGVSESNNLDFHSPYGCSKGAADQYVRDYSRIYGLRTIVFRQSCIYGPHQFGMADQGWIAWFILAILKGEKITIYGDGKQVRDILYVDDLVRAYDLAIKNIKKTSGNIYNIGGGKKYSISVWTEFKPILEKLFGKNIDNKFGNWRSGDQKIYISDIRKAWKDFKWKPEVSPLVGIKRTFDWLKDNY